MDGLVLLDDEQQRALFSHTFRAVQSAEMPQSASTGRDDESDSQTTITNGGSTGKPSLAALSSPRTNFTTRGGAGRSFRVPATHHESYLADGQSPWMFDEHQSGMPGEVFGGGGGDGITDMNHVLSIRAVILGVVVGVILGVILQAVDAPTVLADWVSLPCTLFLRALQCVVVPYVFCSVAVAIGDIVFVGKISIVGLQTAKIFVSFWLTTSAMGLGVALLFRPYFYTGAKATSSSLNAMVLQCANNEMLAVLANRTIACSTSNTTTLSSDATFKFKDVNGYFTANSDTTLTQLSLGDLLENTIKYIVSANLMGSFISNELLSIITFAMVLGSIAGRNFFNHTRPVNYLYLTLLQSRDAMFMMMEWTIKLTPLVLVSFIAGFIASNKDAFSQFTRAYFYLLASVCAALIQVLVLLPAIVFLMTRCNPYNHMKQMLHAYVFAFACSSSIATAPLTLNCIKRARVCSQSLSNFVISIGACSNTSGAGFYVPIAVVFLAESAGDDVAPLTAVRLVGLYALSVLACVGTPPIPAAGLVTVSTIYQALFGVSQLPPGMVYLIALDFIVDRITTVCNVNDDIMAVKIIAENTDETVTQEHLGERS